MTSKEALQKADSLFQSDQYADAALAFENVIRSDKSKASNPLILLNLGHCYSELGEWEKASSHLEIAGAKLTQQGDQDNDDLCQRAFFLLGRAQLKQMKFNFACQSFKRAQQIGQPKLQIAEMIKECEQRQHQLDGESGAGGQGESTADETEPTSSQVDPQNSNSVFLTEEQMLEQYGDLIEDPERLSEGMEVQGLLRAMPTKIEEGSEWFLLPKKWLDKWELWCYVDVINAPLDDASFNPRSASRKNPGRIPFLSLFQDKKDNQVVEQMIRFQWQNYQIKKGQREGVDFIFVTRDVLDSFVSKYRSDEPKPENLFKRVGVQQDDGEVVCEMQLRRINFFCLPNKTMFKMREPWFVYAPKSDSVADLEKKVIRAMNYYMSTVRQERGMIISKCRLWKAIDSTNENLTAIDKKFINYTHSAINALPISCSEEQKKLNIDDLNFVDEDVFLVETQKDGKYVFSQVDGDEEESKNAIASQMAEMAETAQGLFSMEELMAKDQASLVAKRGAGGLCGLQNLGNTCFMNSGIQCMSNTPELTKYFLMGYHLQEKNEDNPLGMKGKLAKAFGALIKEMWCDNQGRTAPYDLKRTLGSRISRFSGYGQQDSAELVNYLLDLIHEDLNRVKSKPYVEMSDTENRPDHVVAKEYWDGFLARNASIIVDLMYGQLKSTVTCLTCGRVANAFDPYLSVCLPIIKEEKMTFNYAPFRSHSKIEDDGEVSYDLNPVVVLDLTVGKNIKLSDIKAATISEMGLQNVRREDLVVVSQKSGRINEIYDDATKCDDVVEGHGYTMIYHVPGKTAETQLVEFNWFKYQKRTKKSFTVDRIEKSVPRLFQLTKEVTLMDIKRQILEQMPAIFETLPENDEELNEMIHVNVKDNAPMLRSSGYAKQKAHCEFCGDRHTTRDEFCDLKFDDVEVNESVEACQGVTLGQLCDKMKYERRLILAIVLKSSGQKYFVHNELRLSLRRLADDEDKTLEGRSAKSLTLASCFNGYSTEETLSGDDQWYCNICKEHRDISKKLELYSVPKIFIIQLKRFQQRRNASGGRGGMFGHMYAQIAGQEKNDAFVDFPTEGLDMRPFAKTLQDKPDPVYYDLIGVSNHFGSLNGGHYTASCKNALDGKWYYFNDSSVSKCSKSQVVSAAAYLLWYRKRD